MATYGTQNICIVGGGSSGWMVASTLIKYFPERNITLIESPKIPNVGVGESTTSMMRTFINSHLGIPDTEFLPEVDGVYKQTVRFEDFKEVGDGGWHYPFGSPYFRFEGTRWETWSIKKHYYPETPVQDFARTFVPQVTLAEQNKISENKHGQFDNFRFNQDLGYHLNANKFWKFLKEKYAMPRGVKHISAEVLKVNVNDKGVESLELDNGQTFTADLYIDCSGFKSILLGEAMKEEFVDISYWLPNNKAWATPTPYKEEYKYEQMRPYTNCTALKNGWAWHTPVWSRIGNGYSYSDKYTTDEEALEEFKQYLMSDKVPGHYTKEEVDSFPYFNVPYKAGYYKRNFVKNVFAIGLSGGFLEPLEGTGLLFVSTPILELCKHLKRPKITQYSIDLLNHLMFYIFEGWKDFLTSFYHLSMRDDSQYWDEITSKSYYLGNFKHEKDWAGNWQNFYEAIGRDETSSILPDTAGFIYVSHGMEGSFDLDQTIVDRTYHVDATDFAVIKDAIKEGQEADQARWLLAAKEELHVYDYLNKYIYKEDNK